MQEKHDIKEFSEHIINQQTITDEYSSTHTSDGSLKLEHVTSSRTV